jgi:aspartate racemase
MSRGTGEERRWPRVIGVVGGLGPHAHVDFERRLLAAVPAPSGDQDYPEWVISSIPATPDRTEHLLGQGPSPVPLLVRSLERLAGHADFAVIACITAHAFLHEVGPQVRLPILDVVAATLEEAVRRHGERARIGLLATTGTLRCDLFARTARRMAPGLELLSLSDLADGWALQEELVMAAVYGPLAAGTRLGGGVKSGLDRDPRTGALHRDTLARAAARLADAGATAIIAGCTEISLAFGASPVAGLPLLDPMQIAARAAIGIARGDLPLPASPGERSRAAV